MDKMSYYFGRTEIEVAKKSVAVINDYKNNKVDCEVEMKFIVNNGNLEISEIFMNKMAEFANHINEEINK